MQKIDLLAVRAAIEAALDEFVQLERDKEWYVADTMDMLIDARQRVVQELGGDYEESPPEPKAWDYDKELDFEDD